MVIGPQRTLQKKNAQLKERLQQGAFVTTTHGISGIVTAILANTIIIRTADGELIEILPWSIASINNS